MPRKTSAARTPIPLDEAELPPLVYDPHWARPIRLQDGGFWNAHWIGFVFLVPFLGMLAVHELLGMSDALLWLQDQRDADAQLFNLLMIAVFYLGSLAFVVYAFALPMLKGQGWRWVLPKLIFWAAYWCAIVAVANSLSKLKM